MGSLRIYDYMRWWKMVNEFQKNKLKAYIDDVKGLIYDKAHNGNLAHGGINVAMFRQSSHHID